MLSIDEALAAVLDGGRAAGGRSACRSPTPPAAWRPRTRAAPSTCRRSTARRWTATRCARPTPRPAWRCGSPASVAAGEVTPTSALAPGTALGDHRPARALPPGRRRDPAGRARRTSDDGTVTRRARARARAATCATAARTCARGDVLAAAGERLTLPRLSALASAGVGEVAVHRRRGVHLLVTGSELLPLGAPPEPGRIHESNGLMVQLLARAAPARRSSTTASCADDREATREAVEARPGGRRAGRLRRRLGRPARPRQARRSRPAGSRRCSGACGSSRASRCGSAAAARTLVFGLPGQPAVEHRLLLRVHRARAAAPAGRGATPARGSVPARLAAPGRARPTAARRSSPPRSRAGADGVLEATPTERQGSHMTGALGESDGFAGRAAWRRSQAPG